MTTDAAVDEIGEVILQCLHEGFPVDIDCLGTFRMGSDGRVQFTPTARLRIFIAYVEEDYAQASALHDALEAAGFEPWLDKRRLLAGQDWERCIERAIDLADFVLPCFSSASVRKRGQFQREIRLALNAGDRMPLGDTFLLPVRLDACAPPRQITARYELVDLFPDWVSGVERLVRSIWHESKLRRER